MVREKHLKNILSCRLGFERDVVKQFSVASWILFQVQLCGKTLPKFCYLPFSRKLIHQGIVQRTIFIDEMRARAKSRRNCVVRENLVVERMQTVACPRHFDLIAVAFLSVVSDQYTLSMMCSILLPPRFLLVILSTNLFSFCPSVILAASVFSENWIILEKSGFAWFHDN